MRLSALRVPLIAGLLLGTTVLIRVAAWPLVRVELLPRSVRSSELRPGRSSAALASESLTVIVRRDPFRIARRPAPVAYDPQRLAAPAESYQASKPALALVGLVAGTEPSAVIEGFPGMDGARVVRVGDVVAGIKVQRIAPEHVRLTGMDTVWVLQVRKPWQ